MSDYKPTILKITNTYAETDDCPDYEIIDNQSGGWYEGQLEYKDGTFVGHVVPDNLTEEEIEEGQCFRDGVELMLFDGYWCRYQGDNSAASTDAWRESTNDALFNLKDQLRRGMIVHVETDYWGDGMFDNAVSIPKEDA